MKNEPIDLSKQRIFTPERNPITPVKLVDRQQQVEPWTPTANLKMLISAASPDIRDREKKKGLFRPIENKEDAFVNSLQVTSCARRPCETSKIYEIIKKKKDARPVTYSVKHGIVRLTAEFSLRFLFFIINFFLPFQTAF